MIRSLMLAGLLLLTLTVTSAKALTFGGAALEADPVAVELQASRGGDEIKGVLFGEASDSQADEIKGVLFGEGVLFVE